MKERTVFNECWRCRNMREVPGNSHIACANPDSEMTGDKHGIKHGWFYYPLLFDPTWKTKLCSNFVSTENAISGSVSGVISEVSPNDTTSK